MIAPLRAAHRVAWMTLAVVLPVVLASVVLTAPTSRHTHHPATSVASNGKRYIVCDSVLRINPVPLAVIGTSDAAKTEDPPASALNDLVRSESDTGTVLAFSSGRTMTLEADSVALLRMNNATPRLEIRATPEPPPLLAYSFSKMVEVGPGLAEGAQLIAEIPPGNSSLELDEEWTRDNSSIAFYSLARNETVAVINFHPEVITMRPCR